MFTILKLPIWTYHILKNLKVIMTVIMMTGWMGYTIIPLLTNGRYIKWQQLKWQTWSRESRKPLKFELVRFSVLYFTFTNFDRCSCGKCEIMPTVTECLCCCEIEVTAKAKEGIVQCIVQHPKFDSVCLNVWLLQTAFYTFLQHYSSSSNEGNTNEWMY